MDTALQLFHQHKNIFIDLGICDDFNIPKVHSMLHYTTLIHLFGSADGFNTKLPEQLHIDFAKKPYRSSNKQDYIYQMTTWLHHQDAIFLKDSYLTWHHNHNHQLDSINSHDVALCSLDGLSDASDNSIVLNGKAPALANSYNLY